MGLKVGIVGCGRQGWRRARAITQNGDEVVVVSDNEIEKCKGLAENLRCRYTTSWRDLTRAPGLDAVLVCTPNDTHLPICLDALKRDKHVLCEKPLARNPIEAAQIVSAAKSGVILKCGFNLRHHPGISQAHEWLVKDSIGEVMFIRSRYGISGREGYEKDWRADGAIAGGGQLMDQGIHLIDLTRWFLGEFSEVVGMVSTSFWNTKVEDNAFCLLRTEKNQCASIHVSWTQWINVFSFEVYGKDGYAVVEGLGGSYGNERATLGRREFSTRFREERIDYRGEDISWREEWKEFLAAIRENRQPLGNGYDGKRAVDIAYAVYKSQKSGMVESVRSPGRNQAKYKR